MFTAVTDKAHLLEKLEEHKQSRVSIKIIDNEDDDKTSTIEAMRV
jgi:hypothetical protein